MLCHTGYVQSDDLPPPSSLHKHARIAVLIANISSVDLASYRGTTGDNGGLSKNTHVHIVIRHGLQLQLTGPETPNLSHLVSRAAIRVNDFQIISKNSIKDGGVLFGIRLN